MAHEEEVRWFVVDLESHRDKAITFMASFKRRKVE
jgi:hypothetical protein